MASQFDLATFRALLEAAPDAMVVVDERGQIVLVNAQTTKWFGYSHEGELLGQPVEVLLPEHARGQHAEHRTRYVAEPRVRPMGKGPEACARRKDGSVFPVEISLSPLQTEAGLLVTAAIRDITERKQAEDALRKEAEISAALARVGKEMISALDAPALLARLCQITAEVLACDYSYTLFWHPEEEVYVPVAEHGFTAEEREVAHAVKVPRDTLSVVLSSLDLDGVAEVYTAPTEVLSAVEQPGPGVSATLCMLLRRGSEVIGVQVAGSRERGRSFTLHEKRIARGIAQLASLTLAHAQVVEQLARANRLKSDFVSTMSHELRTPLNAIIGYNDLLLGGGFGPLTAEQEEALRDVHRSSSNLLELVSATLDLSRLERGEDAVEATELRLSDLLSQVEAETAPLREKPGVGFSWTVEPAELQLHTDPVKLRIVLKNLTANAFKFTNEGRVTVAVRGGDGGVEIAVTDTGIGIAPDNHAIIFEPFRQIEPYLTRRYGGTGLGLYIVRRLLDVLGGTIAVESELGRGTTFHVWLPAATRPREFELEAYIVGSLGCPEGIHQLIQGAA